MNLKAKMDVENLIKRAVIMKKQVDENHTSQVIKIEDDSDEDGNTPVGDTNQNLTSNELLQQSVLSSLQSRVDELEETVARLQAADEDELFFKSLTDQVKKIPPELKRSFRVKVEQLVQEFACNEELESKPNIEEYKIVFSN